MEGPTLRAEDMDAATAETMKRVAHGQSVVITRAGQIIAKVVPVAEVELPPRSAEEMAKIDAAIAGIFALRDQLRDLGEVYSQDDIRRMRDDHGP
jgi:prevent-host-death family protein